MKKQRCIAAAAVLAGVLLLAGCGARVLAAGQKNRELQNGFVQKKYAAETVYRNGAPLETLDFTQVCRYSFSWGTGAAASAQNTAEGSRMELPCDISYYASQEDANAGRNPVLVLKQGETVAVSFDGGSGTETGWQPVRGYGFDCTHPAYQAGWRFARPFLTAAQAGGMTPEQVEALPGYFVRTEELKRAASAYYAAVLENGTEAASLFDNVDRVLFEENKFLAPSVFAPLWDSACTWLAVFGVLLTAAGIAGLAASRRKKNG
ncbi:MAG: hypothetical protein PUC59_10860 [Firmicutes bacterium]|nr:hypothetical protein [Bacillota bacterium]